MTEELNIKDFPRVTYEESTDYTEDIDEVLDNLEAHQLIDPKYKQIAKEQLLMNPNCNLILQYLCQLDELRTEIGSQASMRRKSIGRSLEALDSPIHYFGD